jgi:hypothetical protein
MAGNWMTADGFPSAANSRDRAGVYPLGGRFAQAKATMSGMLVISIIAAVVAALVGLNIWYNWVRANMSPEERE